MTQDEAKGLVAKRAAELVEDGMAWGWGRGRRRRCSSASWRRAQRLKIRCVASSDASHELGLSWGWMWRRWRSCRSWMCISMARTRCAAAGACGLDLIKGGGGALLREKIVASAAKEFICVVDSTQDGEDAGQVSAAGGGDQDGAAAGGAEAGGAGAASEAADGEGRQRAVS